jgi:aryl-alcohol dehydrogenase-like predicted oxidoreductase
MKYRQFGRTGLFVSPLALGTIGFGKANLGESITQAEAERMVATAIDAGVNLFDSSNVYGGGQAEGMLGRALGAKRKQVLVSTKVHARVGPGPNDVGQSRVHMMRALENSLRELNTDWIDLYQIHQFDPLTPFEEVLRTLDDAIRQGKVRYIGCSNLLAWQVMKASKVAAQHGFEEFVSVQAYYSPAGRDIERELVPLIVDQRLALLAYSPLAGGLLTGQITRERKPDSSTRRGATNFPPVDMERGYRLIDTLLAIARRHGSTVPRVALAWLIAQPHLSSAIMGADNMAQLQDNLGAADLALTPDEVAEIEAVSRLPREYPSWATDLSAPRTPLQNRA